MYDEKKHNKRGKLCSSSDKLYKFDLISSTNNTSVNLNISVFFFNHIEVYIFCNIRA